MVRGLAGCRLCIDEGKEDPLYPLDQTRYYENMILCLAHYHIVKSNEFVKELARDQERVKKSMKLSRDMRIKIIGALQRFIFYAQRSAGL